MSIPAIIIHGGAGDYSRDYAEKKIPCLKQALEESWSILREGGSAIDAVTKAVEIMEDCPWLNAGKGSALNSEGKIEMDALIMDGTTLKAGAVGAVSKIKNPVLLARLIMEHSPHILLVGNGAEQFAKDHGIELIDPSELIVEWQLERWKKAKEEGAIQKNSEHDTVGAVAIDKEGNIAVAVSTGGLFMKAPGRVGDTPIIGAGGYADSNFGGASATGIGEDAMRILLSKLVVDFMASGYSAQEAAERAIILLEERIDGKCGVIALDRWGRMGVAKSTKIIVYGYASKDGITVDILE